MPEKLSLALLALVTLISLFCIGLVYLSRNIARRVRLYFCLSIVFLILWVITLYLSNIESGLTLLFNRLVYASPIWAMFFFGLFIDASYVRDRLWDWRAKAGLALRLMVAIGGSALAVTGLNVASVEPRFDAAGEVNGYNIVPGALSWAVVGTLLLLAIIVIMRIVHAYGIATERPRKALRIILCTLVLMLSVSLVTNAAAPIIFGGSQLANAISNLTVVLFVSSVAYSVLRYSFLDIRLLVVRSIGYGAGLATILMGVAFAQVALFMTLADGDTLTGRQQLVVILLSSLAAVSFSPLRRLFARLTSRLFFKDVYDPARFISSFNANLVQHIELDKLLGSSSQMIEQTLKSAYSAVVTSKRENTAGYMYGSYIPEKLTTEDSEDMAAAIGRTPLPIITRETLAGHAPKGILMRLMNRYNIEVVVPLVATSKEQEAKVLVGYIVLGAKKSGDPYNQTDIEILNIISNGLVIAVQNALRFEEIEQFNLTLQQKIVSATERLQATNDKLRRLDQTKDDFISMASHQLRTPLTSIKGYISMVLEGDAGEVTPLQKKLLAQAFVSSQRMVYLISDLLNVSRLRTGRFVIEPTPTHLVTIAREEVAQLQETAKSRGITLKLTHTDHFPAVLLDENKMRQVIMNFIDNAIYYTPEGGHITVHLTERPKTIEFTVVDDGMGVPKADQPHLFTKFFRANNAKRARPDGTGLGLFMAKKVVATQGGAIIFKSTEGKGSTFGFTFAKDKLTVVPNYKSSRKEPSTLLHKPKSAIMS